MTTSTRLKQRRQSAFPQSTFIKRPSLIKQLNSYEQYCKCNFNSKLELSDSTNAICQNCNCLLTNPLSPIRHNVVELVDSDADEDDTFDSNLKYKDRRESLPYRSPNCRHRRMSMDDIASSSHIINGATAERRCSRASKLTQLGREELLNNFRRFSRPKNDASFVDNSTSQFATTSAATVEFGIGLAEQLRLTRYHMNTVIIF